MPTHPKKTKSKSRGNRRSLSKGLKREDRKCGNRGQIREDIKAWGKQVKIEIEAEKRARPTVAEAASVCELYTNINSCQFHRAIKILKDPNLDTEEKKEMMVKFQDEYGTTPLQLALRRENTPYELFELLVQIGGKDAITITDKMGYNTIHCACKEGASPEVIDDLCDFGGKDALYQQNHIGNLPIHNAALRKSASTDVIRKLLQVGGREQLSHNNEYGQLPVHLSVYYFNTNLEVCQILIHEGHHHGVGGEEGVGGLFTEHVDNAHKRRTTYDKLNMLKLSDCILKNIANVASEKYGLTPTQAGAKHGFKWNTMKNLLEATEEGDIKEGLIIYAASGEKADLTTTYELCLRYANVLFH